MQARARASFCTHFVRTYVRAKCVQSARGAPRSAAARRPAARRKRPWPETRPPAHEEKRARCRFVHAYACTKRAQSPPRRAAPRRAARRGPRKRPWGETRPRHMGCGSFFYCSFSRAPSARAPRLFARLVCVRLAGGYLCAQEGPPRVQTFQGPPAGARPGSQPGLAFGARGAAREVRDPQEGLRAFCVRVRAYKTHTKTLYAFCTHVRA